MLPRHQWCQLRIHAGVVNVKDFPSASALSLAVTCHLQVGSRVNIGAGTITCNFDGVAKRRTIIRDGAFIGSNSTLVAPVTVGTGSLIAAGSAVTQNLPEGSLAFGRARQTVKEGGAGPLREKLKQRGA